jgi:hypothetical protein
MSAGFVRTEPEATVCVFFPEGGAGLRFLRAGELTCERAGQGWRVRYDGDVFRVDDLTLVPMYWDHGLFDLPRRRVTLDLTLEDAAAHEHPWGPWRAYRASFDDGRAFKLHGGVGFVRRDGREAALETCEVDESGLTLTTDDGERHRVSVRMVRSLDLPVRRGGRLLMLEQGYARFEWEGRAAFGPVEVAEPLGRGLGRGF